MGRRHLDLYTDILFSLRSQIIITNQSQIRFTLHNHLSFPKLPISPNPIPTSHQSLTIRFQHFIITNHSQSESTYHYHQSLPIRFPQIITNHSQSSITTNPTPTDHNRQSTPIRFPHIITNQSQSDSHIITNQSQSQRFRHLTDVLQKKSVSSHGVG